MKKIEIELTSESDWEKIIFNHFTTMSDSATLVLYDPQNILPDYAKNWNGIEVINKSQNNYIENTLNKNISKNKEMVMSSNDSNTNQFNPNIFSGFSNIKAQGKMPDPLPKPLRLNLGCGRDIKDGFVNIDLFSDDQRVVAMDIRKLEFPDNCADFIFASDILEHFSHRETDLILKEWVRVLKPNGEIIIRSPSLRLQLKAYSEGKWDADVASYMIFGGQTNPGDFHCNGFDEKSIRKHLESAGLEIIEFEEYDLPQEEGFINLNLAVRAKKPVRDAAYTINSFLNKSTDKYSPKKACPEFVQEIGQDKIEETETAGIFSGFDFTVKEEEDLEYSPELMTMEQSNTPKPGPLLNIVWEGSQFVYHSLALINREHCSNILDTGLAELTIIPYENDQFRPEGNPKYEKLFKHDIRKKGQVTEEIGKLPYIWIRHQWPPKVEPPRGAKWIINQPWEFTALRKDFVELFKQADEIWTPSNYSRRSFVDSGLDFNKVQVIPNGIDPELFSPKGDKFLIPSQKKLKFLFVGGTIFRKGVDILLEAYAKAFTANDDVCLFIKDMGGDSFYKGQTAKEQIEQFKLQPNAPEIHYYDSYMSEEQIANLYRACDIFVCPYRGEGFSLPTLEAMACGLPVIVTQGGATDDFVDEEVGWQLPANKRSVGNVIDNQPLTHEAFLLEPELPFLIDLLKDIYNNPKDIFQKGLLASTRARKYWTWKRATTKIFARLDTLYGTSLALTAQDTLVDYKDGNITLGEAEKEFQINNYENAIELYKKAIDSGELSKKYQLYAANRLAVIYVKTREIGSAEELIEKAQWLSRDNIDSKYLCANIYSIRDQRAEALELYTELFDNWRNWKFYSSLGIALDDLLCETAAVMFGAEDIENALQLYSEALKFNNNNALACYGAANCFLTIDAKDEARNMLEWAVKLAPDFVEARRVLEEIQL